MNRLALPRPAAFAIAELARQPGLKPLLATGGVVLVLSTALLLLGSGGDRHLRVALALGISLGALLIGVLLVRRHQLTVTLARTEASLRQIQSVTSDLRLLEPTGEETLRDPGTLLLSRHFLEESLARELVRATRDKTPLGVMLFHLDGLEHLDEPTANRFIRAAGLLLQQRTRAFDIVCRFDRQVLGLLLPGLSEREADRRRANLEAAIGELRLPEDLGVAVPVTIHTGVALHERLAPPENARTLLGRALVALYQLRTGAGGTHPRTEAGAGATRPQSDRSASAPASSPGPGERTPSAGTAIRPMSR